MIDPDELKVEIIYDQTGTVAYPGGQQAGAPGNSIRMTHLPSGIVAQVPSTRSQHKARATAEEMIEWALER